MTACVRCGHRGGLLRLDANSRPMHFDACPDGPAPEPEPVLIAHDPLGTGPTLGREVHGGLSAGGGADPRAIERLRELGLRFTREYRRVGLGAPDGLTGDVHVVAKGVKDDTQELVAPIEAFSTRVVELMPAPGPIYPGLAIALPPPVGDEDAIEDGEVFPLGTRRKPPTTQGMSVVPAVCARPGCHSRPGAERGAR